jgi:dephospho-CoA kinase
MDNAVTIPGYKYYLAPDGTRPDVCVAFVDVQPAADAWVNGVCHAVDAAQLAALDARERNYLRVDVTAHVAPQLGTTWAYVGREDSRRRCERARRTGRCVVARAYADGVADGFRALGEAEWERFNRSTDGPRPPVCDLRRVDLPG